MSVTNFFKFILLIVLSGILSCSKNGTPGKPVKKTGTDVYVVGSINTKGGTPVATYWVNGVAHALVTDTTVTSLANGIAIKDTDVYICGTIGGAAVYWKNNVRINLPGGVLGLGMAINGNDIYVSGCTYVNNYYTAVYWKNGTLVQLGDQTENTYGNSISINGTDVYVGGLSLKAPGTSGFSSPVNLVYWKNGTATVLNPMPTNVQPTSILATGSDVYLTGDFNDISYDHRQAWYYKNGQPYQLTNINTIASATAIALYNENIYIAGYSNGVPCYWENNIEHDLTAPAAQYTVTSISFNNSDMYIAGYYGVSTANAVYWKNGAIVQLPSTGDSFASGIGVVQY